MVLARATRRADRPGGRQHDAILGSELATDRRRSAPLGQPLAHRIRLRRRRRRQYRSGHHFLSWDSPPKQCKIAFAVCGGFEGAPMYKTKIDLSDKVRRNVAAILNDRLAYAIDL